MKILLVDDELDFLKIMESRLKQWGYDVEKATCGKDALEAVKKSSFDAVILDYMMPDYDGITVLREIREFNKEVAVIMFTAYPDSRSMKETEELGISAFIPKLSMYTDVQLSLKEILKMIEEKKEKQ
ncbi:MAG: response regulator [Candidatus Omnitrophica bacterium]|nr:response regulator [Candidatus Omnitrophota bacterium]